MLYLLFFSYLATKNAPTLVCFARGVENALLPTARVVFVVVYVYYVGWVGDTDLRYCVVYVIVHRLLVHKGAAILRIPLPRAFRGAVMPVRSHSGFTRQGCPCFGAVAACRPVLLGALLCQADNMAIVTHRRSHLWTAVCVAQLLLFIIVCFVA